MSRERLKYEIMEKGEAQSLHFTACGVPDAILHHLCGNLTFLRGDFRRCGCLSYLFNV